MNDITAANFSPTDKNSTFESGSGSSSTNSITPTTVNNTISVVQNYEAIENNGTTLSTSKQIRSQQLYEQNVLAEEKSLLNNFSNLIINDNMMNIQNQLLAEEKNAMIYADLQLHENKSVANGNNHDFQSINTK